MDCGEGGGGVAAMDVSGRRGEPVEGGERGSGGEDLVGAGCVRVGCGRGGGGDEGLLGCSGGDLV